MKRARRYKLYWYYLSSGLTLFFLMVLLLRVLADNSGTGGKSPIRELLFGYEEEGFVYYPVTHRNYFFVLISFILILFGAGLLMFLAVRKKSLENKIMGDKLFEKNKRIIDSINYAQNIQKNLLPSAQEIKETFAHAFVFYSPKDIVSGDLYWFKRAGDISFVAAVDCTGHGVPGAFLTIMANNALNKVTSSGNCVLPSEILLELSLEFSRLNHEIQDYTIKDSMDISICAYNNVTRELKFAGAMNNMFLVQNGIVEYIRGNKVPIGEIQPYRRMSNPYNDTSIKLNDGDTFYLFSDGFQDQFGSKEKRRIGRNRFAKIITELYSKNVNEQMKMVKDFFHAWKGSEVQTDDVVLIGVKV